MIPPTGISGKSAASNVSVLLKSLNSLAIVAAIFVVTIVGLMAGEICHGDNSGASTMVGVLPLRIGHIQAKLRKSYWGTAKNVAINNPPPEKHVFLFFSNRLNVAEGYVGSQAVVTEFWSEHEFIPFRLLESVEVGVFVGNGILNCYRHFISAVLRRSRSGIGHSHVKSITSDFLFWVRGKWLKISLVKRDECPLGCYCRLVGVGICLEQKITEYCQYGSENSRPRCSFISEDRIPNGTKYALVVISFLIATGFFICVVVCVWHGLEYGRPFWLFLAILSLLVFLTFSHTVWLLTRK